MIQKLDIVNSNAAGSPVATSFQNSGSISGYCLWEYRSGAWQLKEDLSLAGYHPSKSPASPGAFDGQLRAVLSEPLETAPVQA